MPRVAALLDVMQISDITKVVAHRYVRAPIYAGNAIQTVKSSDAKKVITVRDLDLPGGGAGGSASVEDAAAAPIRAFRLFAGEQLSKSDRPELTSAKIIISGGRAHAKPRELHQSTSSRWRQARRRGRRLARRGRCRLRAERLAGRSDRQGRGAGALYRVGISGAIQHLPG
jgi:electron transfer flavoprotein alpha subunit